MDQRSQDDDNVARLFRENDDIGSDSALLFRPLRQLFKYGTPIGKVVALTVSPTEQLSLPFGILTETEENRLIFWPIWPSGVNMICADEQVDVFDHITLEFPSEKIHVTAYDVDGQPSHVTRAWRTHHFPDCDLALWFTLLVRVSVLRQQDLAVQRRVQTPPTDKERRTNEFVHYAQNLSFANISLPPREAEYDYIYFRLYIAPDSITAAQFSPSILGADCSIDSQIEGWPDGTVFEVALSRVTIGQQTICFATACPPGRLRLDVSVGFPRRTSPQ